MGIKPVASIFYSFDKFNFINDEINEFIEKFNILNIGNIDFSKEKIETCKEMCQVRIFQNDDDIIFDLFSIKINNFYYKSNCIGYLMNKTKISKSYIYTDAEYLNQIKIKF